MKSPNKFSSKYGLRRKREIQRYNKPNLPFQKICILHLTLETLLNSKVKPDSFNSLAY